jgi:hypothetical protein
LSGQHRNLWDRAHVSKGFSGRFSAVAKPWGLEDVATPNTRSAATNGAAKKFTATARIFLPFDNWDALESAASGKMDNIIEAKELQIERKHFYVELRENDRGRFLRITEEAHGRRNSIIVPSTGVDDFTATIAEVLMNNDGAPA